VLLLAVQGLKCRVPPPQPLQGRDCPAKAKWVSDAARFNHIMLQHDVGMGKLNTTEWAMILSFTSTCLSQNKTLVHYGW
jgi:hypothetical protein